MNRSKKLMKIGLSILTIAIIALLYITPPTQAIDYTYDNLGRLIKVVYQPGQEISYSYDSGGNILSITAAGFDDTPPVTSSKLEGQAGQENWYRSDVKVSLSAQDNPEGTGVVKTEYSYDQKTWTTYTDPINFTTEGQTDLYYRSLDGADNLEAAQKTTIKIDKTAPLIEAATTTPATQYGWHNTNVTIHFTASDTLSGVAQVTPDIVLDQEGPGQAAEGSVTDLAGNTAQTSITVNIDKTPPVISGAPTTQPNAAGWYKENITIKYTASDQLSGVDTVSPDSIISSEGADQSATGTVTDKAGNSASVTIIGINLDKTAPVTISTPDRAANKNGWYNNDVQISLSATDKAGGSGVVKTEYSLDNTNWTDYTTPLTINSEGITNINYRSADLADNIEASNQLTIKIDKTPPTITGAPTIAPNQNGWWNTDVTIHYTAQDELSGIDTVTPDTIISTEGANQTLTGTAVDQAGNTASYTVDKINLDKTKPQINITSPGENQEYILNQKVNAAWTTSDNLSGVETAQGTVADGNEFNTATVGENSFTVEATDLAGNQESKTIKYYVRYNYTSLSPANGKKILKGDPFFLVRFKLSDAQGQSVTNAVAKLYLTGPDGKEIEAISRTHVALGLVAGVTDPNAGGLIGDLQDLIKDQIDLEDKEINQILTLIHTGVDSLGQQTAGNQFHYYLLSQQYIFDPYTCNLQTGQYQLRIALDDGTSKYTNIEIYQIQIPLLNQTLPKLTLPGLGSSQPVNSQNQPGTGSTIIQSGAADSNSTTTAPGTGLSTPADTITQPAATSAGAGNPETTFGSQDAADANSFTNNVSSTSPSGQGTPGNN